MRCVIQFWTTSETWNRLFTYFDFFFSGLGIDWENLPNTKPPDLLPYLPSTDQDQEGLHSKYRVNLLKTERSFVIAVVV